MIRDRSKTRTVPSAHTRKAAFPLPKTAHLRRSRWRSLIRRFFGPNLWKDPRVHLIFF
jgi:hypothetical protein